MAENGGPPEQVVVDARALGTLLEFVARAPLPFGRDAIMQAVLDSARPVATVLEPGEQPE